MQEENVLEPRRGCGENVLNPGGLQEGNLLEPWVASLPHRLGLGQLPPSVQQLLAELQQLKPSVSVDSGWEEEFEEDRLWWQH